jgi:DNA-binding NarL/FixJ family response regulator
MHGFSREVQPANARVTRVLIADDHPITRTGLSALLETEASIFPVVGFADDGEQLLQLCETLSPDLILLDLKLPKINGLVVLEQLMSRSQPLKVVVISGQSSGLDFQQASQLGAHGLVSKEDDPEEVLTAIAAVAAGNRYRSSVLTQLLAPLADEQNSERPGELDAVHLTPRERQILALVADGMSNAHVASMLSISAKTAKKHRENIRRKLNAHSAIEIARAAARLGLTSY